MTKNYKVIRDVTPTECPWLENTITEGTILESFEGHTYGCVSQYGIAMQVPTESAGFSEVPYSALELMKETND